MSFLAESNLLLLRAMWKTTAIDRIICAAIFGSGFTPIGRQESHALYGLSRANALLRIGPGTKLGAGENVAVEVWA
jgi:molybdopterin biosynthesis enzyme